MKADEVSSVISSIQFLDQKQGRRLPVPLARIRCCGMIEVEVLKEVVSTEPPMGRYEVISTHTLRGRGAVPALMLLKLLVSQPHRFATKDWLSTQMHQEMEVGALVRLDTMASQLRTLLCGLETEETSAIRLLLVEYLRNGRSSGPGYQLAPFPLLWLDTDALAYCMEHATLMERMGEAALALPFWQRAYQLASRGTYLPDDPYSDWAQEPRAAVEGALRQSVHALARLYLAQQGEGGTEEALRLLRNYWLSHKTDEDALRPLMELLGKEERYQEAETYYQQLLSALREEDRDQAPDPRTQDLREFFRTKQMRRERPLTHSTKGDKLPAPSSSLAPTWQGQVLTPFSGPATQDILEAVRVLEGGIMDQLRRQLLAKAINGAGAALFVSHDLASSSEIAERLAKALAKPSHIDEKTLLYLEKRIGSYWQERNDVSLPIGNLLIYVLEDLQKVTTLLEGSLRPTVRTRLCSIAGTAAMLVGELYYDMSNYATARAYQELAIAAAMEANNAALEAVAWGRNSFAWTYDGNPIEARNSIQQAHRLAWSVNSTVRAWLAAVEAEIHSNLGDREACLKVLKEAAQVEDGKHHQVDNYWIYFDRSLSAGYQGVSFLNLSSLGHKDLVQNAQTALQDALALLDPLMKRRQPTLFVDLAGTYVQQEKIEQACECALKAIDIAVQINSKVFLQRLQRLRDTLEPWRETQYVAEFDGSLAPFLQPKRYQGQVG